MVSLIYHHKYGLYNCKYVVYNGKRTQIQHNERVIKIMCEPLPSLFKCVTFRKLKKCTKAVAILEMFSHKTT